MTTSTGTATLECDLAWIELELESGRIHTARGEGDGVRELCGEIRGLHPLEAAAVPGRRLALDALQEALAPVVCAARSASRVAVAMSGGVDSAVALLAVRDAGFDPVGVTLRLWTDPQGPAQERACCSPAAVVVARETCHSLGLPHLTLDLREQFRRAVVAPFVAGYARGETPNPCIRCNGSFRFVELFALARRLGAARLATGHYARTVRHRGRLLVGRGVDPGKDQSYMLARLDPRRLPRLWFPLGEQTKEQTRARAVAASLPQAQARESQEACFLAGGDYRGFLERHGLSPQPGRIVDEQGRQLGSHEGFWRFTPGQRRGLRVATGSPLYVLALDARRHQVVAGPREALARREVLARPGRLYVDGLGRVEVKLRYRAPAAPGSARPEGRGFRALLDDPVLGVAPGQAAVLYEEDAVVGAGLVARAA